MSDSLKALYSIEGFEAAIDERAQESENWLAFRTRNADLFEGRPRHNAA